MFLDLGENTNQTCSHQALIFRDLVFNTSKVIYCRAGTKYTTDEIIFESLSSEVEIELDSDRNLEENWFQLFYKGTLTCHNETLVGSSGTLSSPNYPNEYLSNEDCFYDVLLDNEDDVADLELHFVFFHTESDEDDSPYRNGLCTSDFLEIQSAESTSKICGDWSGKEHLLVFDDLYTPVHFRFVTNKQQTRPGFFFIWRQVKPTSPVCSSNVVQTSMSLFEIIYTSQSWFDSELDCSSRGGHLARIDDIKTHELLQAHLMTSSDCQNLDAFWIGAHDLQLESDYSWSSGQKVSFFRWFPGWTLFNNYSQQPSDDGLSNEDCVEIRRLFHHPWQGTQHTEGYFWNDRSCNEKNPYICGTDQQGTPWSSSDLVDECDITLSLTFTSPTGKISNLGHHGNQSNWSPCQIIIDTPPGAGIKLQFHVFALEDCPESNICGNDYLEITSTSPDSRLLNGSEHLCSDWSNRTRLLRYVIMTNNAILTFKKSFSRTFSGFLLKASLLNSSNCNNDDHQWEMTSGYCIMMSVKRMSQNEAMQTCEQLNATLLDFRMHINHGLMNDVIQHFTGSNISQYLEKNGSFLQVWIPRSSLEPETCISAKIFPGQADYHNCRPQVQVEPEMCEASLDFVCVKSAQDPGTKTLNLDTIFSDPGNFSFPEVMDMLEYPGDISVTWHIQAPPGHVVNLTISNVDIEFQEDCLYDYIYVADSTHTDRICGQHYNSSIVILSTSNTATVTFISDISETGSGFSMSWQFVDMTLCHQEITVDTSLQIIRSVHFSNVYPARLSCSLTLRSLNPTAMIVLNFSYIQPLSFLDGMSLFISDGESCDILLNESFYAPKESPVFVSSSSYMKLDYVWEDGLQQHHGFEGHVYAGHAPLELKHRIMEMTGNSTKDIYSINFPGYLSGDVTDTIIIHAPIGYKIQVTLVYYDVIESTPTQASIKFEEISILSGETELLACFCFGLGNSVEDNATTPKHVHKQKEGKNKIHPFMKDELGVSTEKPEAEKDISDTKMVTFDCSWMSGSDGMDVSVMSVLNRLQVTIASFPGSSGFRVHMLARAVEGPMCTDRLDEEKHETTLGQRLLKEPIWIGLIVILIVVTLIGVLYIVRRRCGKYFSCREVKSSKDDNILNSDGTITLNSYPLRKVARPSGISIISASSPTLSRDITIKENDTPHHSPGIQIWDAAAKFFEAYKDTEHSLVSTPLTTDFSRTTDTSMSQVPGDTAVGAVVDGRLQLNFHVRENKEQQEAMRRSQSLLQIAEKPRTAIKHSRSAENFQKSKQSDSEELCQSSRPNTQEERRAAVNDVDHIYPHVIVRSPTAMKRPKGDIAPEKERTLTNVPEIRYVDSSGARIIQVNLGDNSEDSDDCDFGSSETEYDSHRAPAWRHHSHSADSIHQLEQAYHDAAFRGRGIPRDTCDYGFLERKNKILAQNSTAMLDVQNELSKRHRFGKYAKSRSKLCFPNKSTPDTHLLRRTPALDDEPAHFNDSCRTFDQFSNKMKRVSSCILDPTHRGTNRIHPPFSDINKIKSLSCDCPACWFDRSESLTSNISSASGCNPTPGDTFVKDVSCKDRLRRMDAENVRSYSTSSDQTTKHSKRHRRGGSHRRKHKQYKTKQGSVRSLQVNYSSSTDSDLLKLNSRQNRCNKKHSRQREEKKHNTSKSGLDETSSSPAVDVSIAKNPDTVVKDLFQTVFSQEIDLDDFSLPDEDHKDLMLRCKPNSKENFLASEPQFSGSPKRRERSEHVITIVSDVDKVTEEDEANAASLSSNGQRKCSIVTMLAGSSEIMSVSANASVNAEDRRDTIASSESSSTPTTCNVIMYDSNRSLDNHDTPPTIKTRFYLRRKHSSLDLMEPLRLLPGSQQTLRTASSMQELYDIPQTNNDEQNFSGTFDKQGLAGSEHNPENRQTVHEKNVSDKSHISHSRPQRQNNVDITVDNCVDNNLSSVDSRRDLNNFLSLSSSPENSRRANRQSNHAHPGFGITNYLSVTDTDSALSSAPSPHNTPNTCQNVLEYEHTDPKVKDSAYQTKQSSVEADAFTDARIRRQILPIKDEDRKVTQRLHQAAVKLLVMQQRLRRARQNMSKDSAVHTISEDDANLDDLTVSSPNNRAAKPGSTYPGMYKDDLTITEFSPLQCSKIVEEQEAVIEFEV